MRHFARFSCIALYLLVQVSCAKDSPYLSGHIRRVHDAVLTTCDPYNLGVVHSCVVFSSAFKESLYMYDATASEMVLSPMTYFPLKVKVGKATDQLVSVVSDNKQFPILLAVDQAEPSLYAVRLFPSDNKSQRSFETPKKYSLDKAPHYMAAVEVNDAIIAIMTYPLQGQIKAVMLNKETGAIDAATQKTINIGVKPARVVIDSKKTKAVISDEGDTNLHILDLANITDVLTKGAAEVTDTIAVGGPTKQIYLSRRDFGGGVQSYALVFKSSGKEINLVNIDSKHVESLSVKEDPIAAYFPDLQSDACCKGNKKWLSVASIKGTLTYYSIIAAGGGAKLEKLSTVDLTSENNLALSKIHIKKILGGSIEVDPKLEREKLCSSNRETFYISSYGNRRSYLDSEPHEEEAHGYSCEGEETASRFGFKTK
jgi:hypothetical protein